ncbi:MAG: lysylphosphatidylglycerol synthase transmembrane domain-containing protein [Nitrospinota bacterium]
MKKVSYSLYIGIAVSLAFVAYAVTQMDLLKALHSMLEINPAWIVPFIVASFFSFYFRALRWWYIIEPTKKIPVKNLFPALAIGFMGNMIFPMRLGEFIRAYVIAKKERISASGAFATIVVERVFDVLATVVLLLIVMLIASPQQITPDTWEKLKGVGAVFAAIMIIAFAAFYFLADGDNALNRLFLKLINLLPEKAAHKGAELFESFCSGLQVVTKGGHIIATLGYSALVWVSIVASYLFFLPMVGLPISVEMACVVTLFVIFGVVFPSSPGFVWPVHADVVLAIGFYGVDAGEALGMAIVIHLLIFMYTVLQGLFFLWSEKMTLSEISHSAD